jgi:hypothetical protein
MLVRARREALEGDVFQIARKDAWQPIIGRFEPKQTICDDDMRYCPGTSGG